MTTRESISEGVHIVYCDDHRLIVLVEEKDGPIFKFYVPDGDDANDWRLPLDVDRSHDIL